MEQLHRQCARGARAARVDLTSDPQGRPGTRKPAQRVGWKSLLESLRSAQNLGQPCGLRPTSSPAPQTPSQPKDISDSPSCTSGRIDQPSAAGATPRALTAAGSCAYPRALESFRLLFVCFCVEIEESRIQYSKRRPNGSAAHGQLRREGGAVHVRVEHPDAVPSRGPSSHTDAAA